jgi:hypothetical protein
MSANLDTVGVNDPLLFNLRSSRLEDLVGEVKDETEEVETVVGVLNVVVKGRRGEMLKRSSSISETDWVRGMWSTVESSKKVLCPVKKQNLQGRSKKLSMTWKKKSTQKHVLVDKLAIMSIRTQILSIFIARKRTHEYLVWRRVGRSR